MAFTVIGTLAKKEQNNSYSGLDGTKMLIPYTTMARHFPDPRPFIGPGHIDNLLFMPVTPDDHLAAVKQVRRLLGRRHGFDPADEGAIWILGHGPDGADGEPHLRLHGAVPGFMAFITLALGGIGVMNIMLVSVAERTREIGVKQAVGATPGRILFEFFLEAVTLTIVSGLIGLVVAWGICAAVSRMPLPTLVCRAAGVTPDGFDGLRHAGAGRDSLRRLPRPARLVAGAGRSPEVRMIRHIISEALNALGYYRLRSALTMLSIIWGVASLVLLLAYGQGFDRALRQAFLQIGKDLVVVFPGQTSLQAGGERSGRPVLLEAQGREEPSRKGCRRSRRSRPNSGTSYPLVFNDRTRSYSVAGVYAAYGRIRDAELAAGRFLSEEDVVQHRRVVVIGERIRHELFSGMPALGADLKINGVRFTVIGILREEDADHQLRASG